ncbi:MAG: TatD family hydrolase [Bacteroidales bacterium]
MIEYIDTHVHLYDEAYNEDFDAVLSRIKSSGVIKCVLPGIDSSYFNKQEFCAKKCKGFAFEAMGLHPTSVDNNWKEELNFALSKLYGDKKYVAIGEVGLDGHWSSEFMKEQMDVFEQQLIAANELNLPVIIHAREATNEIFSVLERVKRLNIRGVFHAFAGSLETFNRIMLYGNFKVGIGGVVTYKNASVVKTLENIKLEDIVLETDAPWLTPVPFRGKRNESTYIEYIARQVAQIKGVTLEEVASVTTQNAIKLFKI